MFVVCFFLTLHGVDKLNRQTAWVTKHPYNKRVGQQLDYWKGLLRMLGYALHTSIYNINKPEFYLNITLPNYGFQKFAMSWFPCLKKWRGKYRWGKNSSGKDIAWENPARKTSSVGNTSGKKTYRGKILEENTIVKKFSEGSTGHHFLSHSFIWDLLHLHTKRLPTRSKIISRS